MKKKLLFVVIIMQCKFLLHLRDSKIIMAANRKVGTTHAQPPTPAGVIKGFEPTFRSIHVQLCVYNNGSYQADRT